ncbi:MAG: glycosyltransferase [Nocardioidaceae bacterium]
MSATISVIVPVYNAGSHLHHCLESIQGQTHAALEIIVVDDGSTDDSSEIIESFTIHDPRFTAVRQDNAGVSSARNAGLTLATGDYVSFVDADDWLEPTAYEQMLGAINHDGVDFATCGYSVDDLASSRAHPIPDEFLDRRDTKAGLDLLLGTPNRFVYTRIFRRELVRSTRFREDLHWGEDTIFVLEVIKRAQATACVAQPLYHYVQSEGSATRSAFNPKRLTGLTMTDVLQELIGSDYPDLIKYAHQTRIGIFAELFQDVYAAHAEVDPAIKPQLITDFRRVYPDIIRCRGLSLKDRTKATLIAISPWAFVQAHEIGIRGRAALAHVAGRRTR